MMNTLIMLVALIVIFAFVLFAAHRLNILSEKGKVDSAPFKRLSFLTVISWSLLFFLMMNIIPSVEI